MSWRYRVFTFLSIMIFARVGAATEPPDPKLTVERIFGAHEFEPESVSARWLPLESKSVAGYTTLEPSKGPFGGRDIVVHDAASGERRVLVPAELLVPKDESAPLAIDNYAFSTDQSKLLIYTNSRRVWRQNTRGDYWVLDRSSHELRKLGGPAPASTLMHAKFTPDGTRVTFVSQNNLFIEELDDRQITALTNTGGKELINGTFDWVYEEELGLRDGYRISPDGKWIAFWQLDTSGVREFPLVNTTDSLYPTITPVKYPKAGQKNAACRIGVVSAGGQGIRWLEVPGDPREHYIGFLEWAGNSRDVLLQQLNRHQNEIRVLRADVLTGTVKTIITERDAAWLDLQDVIPWTDPSREFLWLSERDGWRHIYRVDNSGKQTLITPGEFDVIEPITVDQKGGQVYFIASPDNPTQRYLYRVRLDGTGLERVTPSGSPGTHEYQISPDARYAIHKYSAMDVVPTTDLIKLPSHERVRVLVENKGVGQKFAAIKKKPTEFFRVDIGDGIALDGWCLLPPDFNPATRYPLLVHVYGEPAGQTVLDRWGGGNHFWHLMLAQRGVVVMCFDNRGTPAPRGRAWRKVVYRQVGILAPREQAAAVREVIKKRPYLDDSRIGVWGWSGGGSMTLNAIFKFPDLYSVGIAVAPVPNQRFYDTIYQERYMGLPAENVDGYTQGSVVNFASQLKGKLLLIHGTGDDNCHYQGTEALINELILHNKPFSMMAYPNRSHAINEGRNTTVHLRTLMTNYLEANLSLKPAAPVPQTLTGTR
jgi:dipeptidyl-peptidase-4